MVNSAALKSLFRNMLSVGNFINQGYIRGAAFGLKLKSLRKFNETRGLQGMPLLYFVIKNTLKDKEGDE